MFPFIFKHSCTHSILHVQFFPIQHFSFCMQLHVAFSFRFFRLLFCVCVACARFQFSHPKAFLKYLIPSKTNSFLNSLLTVLLWCLDTRRMAIARESRNAFLLHQSASGGKCLRRASTRSNPVIRSVKFFYLARNCFIFCFCFFCFFRGSEEFYCQKKKRKKYFKLKCLGFCILQ